jgi:5-methyltetrahydrofolate--homocysteine methyltransferase
MAQLADIVDKVIAGDWKEIAAMTQEVLDSGVKAEEIIHRLQAGMEVVGEKYTSGEYFLPDMMKSARCMNLAFEVLKSAMKGAQAASLGKIVIGTVKGDMHDIGKNIVVGFLKGVGFEVIDLGTDVSAEKFCEAIVKEKPQILGLSTLLTTTMHEIGVVVKVLEEKGLRSRVKVVAGGAPVTEGFALRMGADAYGADGGQAIKVCKSLMQA